MAIVFLLFFVSTGWAITTTAPSHSLESKEPASEKPVEATSFEPPKNPLQEKLEELMKGHPADGDGKPYSNPYTGGPWRMGVRTRVFGDEITPAEIEAMRELVKTARKQAELESKNTAEDDRFIAYGALAEVLKERQEVDQNLRERKERERSFRREQPIPYQIPTETPASSASRFSPFVDTTSGDLFVPNLDGTYTRMKRPR